MKVLLNGELMDLGSARVSVLDRGFLMGDSLYEGLRAERGVVLGLDQHVERMRCGLEEAMFEGFDGGSLGDISRRLLEVNGIEDAFIYVQVTRGVPAPGAPIRGRGAEDLSGPTVFAYAEPIAPVRDVERPGRRDAIVVEDLRWRMGHLKSNSLMGGVIPAMRAMRQGRDEAIFVRDGLVGEATATNLFLAIGEEIVTPSLDSASILDGVTRSMIMGEDPSIREGPVTQQELRSADEIILVGTRTLVAQVATLDGQPVGEVPGPRAGYVLGLLKRAAERHVHCAHG